MIGGSSLWSIAFIGMFVALLVVFALRLRRQGGGSMRPVILGVVIGLGVAGIALVAALAGR